MRSYFYFGINPRWQQYSWLPKGINMMYSAAGFWDGANRAWRKRHWYPPRAGSRWLDSGGFTMMNKYGDYPFTVAEFMNLVAFLRPHYYASLDYPCEPEITRTMSLSSNLDRICATVEKVRQMSEWEDQVSARLVPVIQGYSLEEYRHCIDLYHKAGLIREYMAVGSMCRRISSDEIHHLLPGIYEHSRQAGCKRLHFFGLKLSPDLRDLGEIIYSRDSAVAMDSYSEDLKRNRGGRRWARGQQEKQENFNLFLSRLKDLGFTYLYEGS